MTDGSTPANGYFDFRFALYDSAGGGAQQGAMLTNSAAVTNGLFSAVLDFGQQFSGAGRWLEISVRTNGGNAFTVLAPRQLLTAIPYAVRALSASNVLGTVSAAQISGSLDATTVGGVTAAGFWKANGNAGANPSNGSFLGTSDELPLEVKVNSQRALRLEPNPTTPNIIAGSAANEVTNGNYGALIAGGGSTFYPNRVGAPYASVLGGAGNTASGNNAVAMGQFTTSAGYAATSSGYSTTAGGLDSFAAGTLAKANHDGSFVWADATFQEFTSTANNQFVVRASGGVGINTNNPHGAALAVNGNLTVSGSVSVPNGNLVKSVNGMRDDVVLTAGNGLAVSSNRFSLSSSASRSRMQPMIRTH